VNEAKVGAAGIEEIAPASIREKRTFRSIDFLKARCANFAHRNAPQAAQVMA
jgi:hypothetical protein